MGLKNVLSPALLSELNATLGHHGKVQDLINYTRALDEERATYRLFVESVAHGLVDLKNIARVRQTAQVICNEFVTEPMDVIVPAAIDEQPEVRGQVSGVRKGRLPVGLEMSGDREFIRAFIVEVGDAEALQQLDGLPTEIKHAYVCVDPEFGLNVEGPPIADDDDKTKELQLVGTRIEMSVPKSGSGVAGFIGGDRENNEGDLRSNAGERDTGPPGQLNAGAMPVNDAGGTPAVRQQ